MFVLLTVLVLQITACGKEVQTASVEKPADTATPQFAPSIASPVSAPIIPGNVVNNDPDSSSFNLTYYQLTKTIATLSSPYAGTTIVATGNCVVYNGNNYCWDDGIHRFAPIGLARTFWGMDDSTHGLVLCPGAYGECVTDPMTAPVLMDANVINVLSGQFGSSVRTVNQVLTVGTPIQVSCTETNGIVNCTDFSIDTNQSPM